MRFDNFPLELKRKIFSHFSRRELSEKISPVSKQWHVLAQDSFNWRNVEFFNDRDSIRSVKKVLRGTRVEKITFHNYNFYCFNLSAFPVLNSVQEVKFENCKFSDSDALRIFGRYFPNTLKFSIHNQPEDENRGCDEFVDELKYLPEWKNLKSMEFNKLYRFSANCVMHHLMAQDLHLEELILLKSGIVASVLAMIIDRQGKTLQTFAFCCDNGFDTNIDYGKLICCRNLKSLSLFWPIKLKDNEFIQILQQLNQLTYVRVERAHGLFDDGFGELFKNVILHQVEELILENCCNLTDNFLTLIVKNSPLLKRLTLRSLKKITDESLESFPNIARNLKILHLESMKSVTKRCLTKIYRDLPNLWEVVAKDCPQISHETKYCIFKDPFRKKSKTYVCPRKALHNPRPIYKQK